MYLPKPLCWLLGTCLLLPLLGCEQKSPPAEVPPNQTTTDEVPSKATTSTPQAPPSPVSTPSISVKEIMVGAIEPASNAIWAIALEENAPQAEADWQAVEHEVIQLLAATAATAAGSVRPQDRTWAQQPAWQEYSQQMATVGMDILGAVRARDYQAAVDASNWLVEPCGACHAAFPGESQVPTDDKQITEPSNNPSDSEATP